MRKSIFPQPMVAPEIDLETLDTLIGGASSRTIQPTKAAALSGPIRIAQGGTYQRQRVADFLLASWNAGMPILRRIW